MEATLAVGQDRCHASSTLHEGCWGSLAGKWRRFSFFCEVLCLLSTPLQWCRHWHSLPQEGGLHCRGSAGKAGSIAALQRLILLEQKAALEVQRSVKSLLVMQWSRARARVCIFSWLTAVETLSARRAGRSSPTFAFAWIEWECCLRAWSTVTACWFTWFETASGGR